MPDDAICPESVEELNMELFGSVDPPLERPPIILPLTPFFF